jgi:hypothetical protein
LFFVLLEKKEVMKRILLAVGLLLGVLMGLNSCAVEGTAYPNAAIMNHKFGAISTLARRHHAITTDIIIIGGIIPLADGITTLARRKAVSLESSICGFAFFKKYAPDFSANIVFPWVILLH